MNPPSLQPALQTCRFGVNLFPMHIFVVDYAPSSRSAALHFSLAVADESCCMCTTSAGLYFLCGTCCGRWTLSYVYAPSWQFKCETAINAQGMAMNYSNRPQPEWQVVPGGLSSFDRYGQDCCAEQGCSMLSLCTLSALDLVERGLVLLKIVFGAGCSIKFHCSITFHCNK
jgi:hypothetical protein